MNNATKPSLSAPVSNGLLILNFPIVTSRLWTLYLPFTLSMFFSLSVIMYTSYIYEFMIIFACLYICVVIFIGHPPGRYGHHEFPTPSRTRPHSQSPIDPTPVLNLCHCSTRLPYRIWPPELVSGQHRVLSPRVAIR